MDRVKKVALVLGSGSSRGWAHIGAIEALLEENIPIDFNASFKNKILFFQFYRDE